MSGWRAKAVRIARDERSSPGATRMGFRGSAAGAAGAPGVATKNLPNYLGWRPLEAWGDQATPQTWIKGAIGNGPYQQVPL
jgi:hypothetical protein